MQGAWTLPRGGQGTQIAACYTSDIGGCRLDEGRNPWVSDRFGDYLFHVAVVYGDPKESLFLPRNMATVPTRGLLPLVEEASVVVTMAPSPGDPHLRGGGTSLRRLLGADERERGGRREEKG